MRRDATREQKELVGHRLLMQCTHTMRARCTSLVPVCCQLVNKAAALIHNHLCFVMFRTLIVQERIVEFHKWGRSSTLHLGRACLPASHWLSKAEMASNFRRRLHVLEAAH